MAAPSRPLRVAVVDDYELVEAGVAAVLAPYEDRVVVVRVDRARRPVRSDLDVVLHGALCRPGSHQVDFAGLITGTTKVVVFSWDLDPERISLALARGAAGYLAKSLPAAEIVASLERVHAGETVVSPAAVSGPPTPAPDFTPRETEIVAMVARGLSNQEIADQLFLSLNSIKTHVRSCYRKMGVTRRSQAVGWALAHGFTPQSPPAAGAGRRARTGARPAHLGPG